MEHWMLSVMPEEIGAQATSLAVRVASSRVGADAVEQFWLPLYVMHTSQLYCPKPSVEYTSVARTARPKRRETMVALGMIQPSRRARLRRSHYSPAAGRLMGLIQSGASLARFN